MTRYVARFLDRKQITLREMDFRSASHGEAIQRLSSLAHHYALELWADDQIIWRFDPHAPVKASAPKIGARVKADRKPRAEARREDPALRLVADAA